MPFTHIQTTLNTGLYTIDPGAHPDDYALEHSLGLADFGAIAFDPSTGDEWKWSGTGWLDSTTAGLPIVTTIPAVPVPPIPADIGVNKFLFLSDTGNGPLGNLHMNVNASGTTVHQFYKPGPTERFEVSHFTIHIQDSGSLDAGSYGNGIALTNGIQLVIGVGADLTTIVSDVTENIPVKTNGDWGRFGANITNTSFGAGDNFLSIDFNFENAPLIIDGSLGLTLGLILNDNFSALNDHTAFLRGVAYTV